MHKYGIILKFASGRDEMPRANMMQGVPAQREYLRSNDNKRRHPSRCIFADGTGKSRICTCPQSIFYYQHCSSASKCDYYEEKIIKGENK